MFHSNLLRSVSRNFPNSYDAKYLLQSQVQTISSLNENAVIRIPVGMSEKMELQQKKKEWQRKQSSQLKHSQQGKKSELLISCKRKEYNHYVGQTYSKFTEVPLASKGWQHKKSAGDYFTINSYGKNPAFLPQGDEMHDNFDSLGLSMDLIKQIKKLGYEKPTNIQTLAIPQVIDGVNSLITAETGNGKTLAYVAPILQQIAENKYRFEDLPLNSPFGIIITPSRELAEQIHGVASTLGKDLGINVKLIKGGRTKSLMKYPKMTQVDLVVATLGALSKLTTTGIYKRDMVRHIVFDEADSLLDDSFNEKLMYYMSKFPIQGAETNEVSTPTTLSGVQLTLVSATMPRSLHTILDPVVNVDSLVRISTPYLHRIMPHVPQKFFRVNNRTKVEKLLDLIKNEKRKGVPFMIFCNKSRTSYWLSMLLKENNVPCINLNGEICAKLRKDRFIKFQSGEVSAMTCTDIASRGLDTVTVGHIINYDFPTFVSDYIHRCGRTGRVGSSVTGLVTSLICRTKEIELVQKIEYAARKTEEFHNVNANIKRTLVKKVMNQDEVAV